jgi:hypothetical protein
MVIVCCIFQEADPNVWLSIWQHGGGDVGTVVLVLCQPAGSTAGKPPRYTASFCAVDHHDKLSILLPHLLLSPFYVGVGAGAIPLMCIWQFYTCIHLKFCF